MTIRKRIALLAVLALFGLTAAKITSENFYTRPQHFVSSAQGYLSLRSNCVTTTTNSTANTQVMTAVIPAGARSLGVTCRVNTAITGAAGLTSFSLGDGTDVDLYGAGIALAAGTTISEANYTANPLTQAWSASAANLTLTGNGTGTFSAGAITCCSHYYEFTAPTT